MGFLERVKALRELSGREGRSFFPKAWETHLGLRSWCFGKTRLARAGFTAFGKMGVRAEPSRKQRVGLWWGGVSLKGISGESEGAA